MKYIEKLNISRGVAILIIYFLFFIVSTLLIIFLGPLFQSQFNSLIKNLPGYLEQVKVILITLENNPLIQRLPFSDYITLDSLIDYLYSKSENILQGFGIGFSTVFTIIVNISMGIVILPLLLFYMLKDGEKFTNYLIRNFPEDKREEALLILRDMAKNLGAYIQGQIMVSISVGVLVYIGFLIIGLDYPLVLALIAILVNFIPYIGPVIGTIPALIVGFVISPFMALKVLILIVIVQQIESLFISPQVMGEKLHIHPLLIVFILIISGYIAGIIGVILAIPVYVVLRVIVKHSYHLYKLKK